MQHDDHHREQLPGEAPAGAAGPVDVDLDLDLDLDRANAARMYDYWLGGGHHFAVDRDHADRITTANPAAVPNARANRAFLARTVRWCLHQGIDQFLDLGSGVPTAGNVHDIAHALRPAARIAYVDFEPVAVAHATEYLAGCDDVSVTHADLRDATTVLAAPGVAGLIDLARPVALLAIAVLHYVPEPLDGVLAPYLAALGPGSAVVLSHVSHDQPDPELAARIHAATQAYRGSATEVTLRTRADLTAPLDDLDLVAPGLVDITRWPDPQPGSDPTGIYGVVASIPPLPRRTPCSTC